MIRCIKVQGNSMEPEYQSGDFVVIGTHQKFFPIKIGNDIVFQHPTYGTLIKRVKLIHNSILICEGLNNESLIAEKMGEIKTSQILGKVVFAIKSSKS